MADQTFTAGQILTAAQMTTLQSNIGLTYIDTVTWSSGAATQSFDSKFTSSFTNYKVILTLDGTTNDVALSAQMRASTTPTTSNYKWVSQMQYPAIAAVGVDGSNAASSFSFGSISDPSTVSQFEIYRPQTAAITVVQGMTDNIQGAFSNAIQWYEYRGHLNDTTAYDGMQFTVSGGTFTGSAVIYGYRKA
jgi:hypothetical protein